MLNQRKLIIIGGGVVENVGKKYFGRSQIVEYLNGFKAFYPKITWATHLAKSRNYNTLISQEKNIKLDIINIGGQPILTLKGILLLMKHYLKFARHLDKSTDVIVNGLSLTTFPYLFLARLLGRKSLYYLGSDPILTKNLRSGTLYGRVVSWLNIIALPIILKCTNGVLVRGKTTFDQCQRWNKNTNLSKPLISYHYLRKIAAKENNKSN